MANTAEKIESVVNGKHEDTLLDHLRALVKTVKQRKQVSYFIRATIFASAVFILFYDIQLLILNAYHLAAISFITAMVIQLNSSVYQSVNLKNLLEHFNRMDKRYQESCQLLLETYQKLSLLQQIQRDKVIAQLSDDMSAGKLVNLLPKIPWRSNFKLILLPMGTAFVTLIVLPLIPDNVTEGILPSESRVTETVSELKQPSIQSANVLIQPPGYTKLPAQKVSELNLQVLEGSSVQWNLQFEDNGVELAEFVLIDADENRFNFVSQNQQDFQLDMTIKQTTFYRFAYRTKQQPESEIQLSEIYSIAVTRDQLPKIKIIEPNQTLVEIAKSEDASFAIEAEVRDDFGISDVSILASVAKGSGEAVKFRDESFTFDRSEIKENKTVYFKNWSLKSLGMEPGDEVYFSIVAKDNKQPEPQEAKSSSVIVRWQDEEITELAAEGIQIRFVPEYFRSQRQIIIETEQLIADKKDLTDPVFKETSVDLGFSQKDLKEKYGQYLGDEFGEGPGEMHGLADGYHGGEDVAHGEATAGMEDDHNDHQEEGHDDHAEESAGPEVGHIHEDGEGNSMLDSTDLSGASELIARFGHNHGSVEVGPLSGRDPKSWMKMAVSVMWQAELHLMMHEPELALPYEYEAYNYLKLARQAERIYVKRLGFEPPPVKESNRLTGELKDILTYEQTLEDTPDKAADNYLFTQGFSVLSDPDERQGLSVNAKETLSSLKARLMELAETRPILINYAATVERVLVADKVLLADCDSCVSDLTKKLWQLVSRPVSLPQVPVRFNEQSSDKTINYQQQQMQIYERIKNTRQGSSND